MERLKCLRLQIFSAKLTKRISRLLSRNMLPALLKNLSTPGLPMCNQNINLLHPEDGCVEAWITTEKTDLGKGVMAPIQMTGNPGRQLQSHLIHQLRRISGISKAANAMAKKKLMMGRKSLIKSGLIPLNIAPELLVDRCGGELAEMAPAG